MKRATPERRVLLITFSCLVLAFGTGNLLAQEAPGQASGTEAELAKQLQTRWPIW